MTITPHNIKKLAKFLDYALGRRPDEFGLLPDDHGFVKIKTLLQALREDSEWRHLKEGHLRSLVAMRPCAPIELVDDLIRACDRDDLPAPFIPSELPKLLFTYVRRRAYPVVLAKGIRPGGVPFILLSSDMAMAQRLGHRVDNTPVLVSVQVARSKAAGTTFRKFGELLYLADFIDAQSFTGPPLPKEKPTAAPSKPTPAQDRPKTPGSFFPDPASIENPGIPPRRRKREMEWKKDRRRARKEKERSWK
jgi:putative RNA 2'-phosphotransferase